MERHEIYYQMSLTGMVPLFYNDDLDTSKKIVAACYEGGAKFIEFTNRGGKAIEVFIKLKQYIENEGINVCLGVGSVIDPQTAAVFGLYGADFFVGPFFNKDLAVWCNQRMLPYIPGCSSALEINTAQAVGLEIIKIFPGNMGGPAFIKAILGPMPWSKLMPTGGVSTSPSDLEKWFKAGSICVGLGSKLIKSGEYSNDDLLVLSETTEQTLQTIQKIKAELTR
jgi:2-dehydro-3-deoxyphosphogluconate aldolase/(4S)-4-hydroxy-2-oxoglutarate aldolase